MKQTLYLLLAMALLLGGCADSGRQRSRQSTIDSLTVVLYDLMSDAPQRALAMIDSLEQSGDYSPALANARRAQFYSEQYQPRVSEVYALRALKDERLKQESPNVYYFVYNLLINSVQNVGNTERALTYATEALAQANADEGKEARAYAPDFLASIGSSQFKLDHNREGNESYERAYALYEDLLTDATSFSWFYPELMLTVDAIDDNVASDSIEVAMRWLPHLEQSYRHTVATKDIPVHVKDDCTAMIEITQAKLYATAGRQREADAHYQAFLATDMAHDPVGRKSAMSYLEQRGRWHELAQAVEATDSFYTANESYRSMNYLRGVLGRKFNTQMHLGRRDDALLTAQRLISLLDTVHDQTISDDASELAVLYETQEKEQKIAEQQADILHQRWIGTAVALVLIVIFFVVYAVFRRRAAQRLSVVSAQKERIESELRIARNIQMSMVPSVFPHYTGLDLYARMTPAREVGGDLYDYLLLGDKLYFCVGDVSGKGVPASLFMSQTLRLFRTLAKRQYMPAEIATDINNELTENNENGMFVTMFIALLDLRTGHLSYCNAGHNPPVLGGGAAHGDFMQMESNAPIGLWSGLDFVGEEIDTVKNRPLFVYTDGLNEAENQQQEQFGEERLLNFLRTTDFDSARQVIDTMQQKIEKHRDGAEPNDDLTMLCLRIN